jgi:hypothetical protein
MLCLFGAFWLSAWEPYQLAEVIEDKLQSTPAATMSRMDWFNLIRPQEPAGTLLPVLTFGPLLILFLIMLRDFQRIRRAFPTTSH